MRLKLAFLVSFLAVVVPLHAAVVIAPSDETMIRTAPAIVTGTVVNIYVRHDDRGNIETVSRILVDESIKGTVAAGDTIDVVQFGGWLDGRFQVQSGAPTYELGARYLVVLDRNGRGQWTTFDLALGQFRFLFRDGRQRLARDTHDIDGWTESGQPFHDEDRPAAEFLSFAREIAKSPQAQWQLKLSPAPHVLDFNLTSTSQTAVNTWHGAAAAMNDTISGSPATGDVKDLNDSEARVIADDPHGDVSGTCCPGVVGTAFFGGSGSHTFLGETYFTLTVADIVINDGVSSGNISAGSFQTALTHEFGHTWGFRHSNQNASNGSCALPLPCDTNAVMNSSVVSGLNGTLQNWDKDAANEAYVDGTRQATFTGTQYMYAIGGQPARRPSTLSWRISQSACTAPTINTQPQSQTINSGQQANLSVSASGTATLTYLWYTGTPPSGPVAPGPNNTSTTYQPSPTSTTTYWVRVTNSCGHIDSGVATVTVNQTGCTPPSISTQPQSQAITSGQQANLTVTPAGTGPFTYQWFVGNPPNTSTPAGATQSISPSPTQTTNYWVRVTGQCGTPADSNAATVTVSAGCSVPFVVNDPPDQSITSGSSTSLFVGYSGTTSTVTWYRGAAPDQSNPVFVGQSFVTGPLTQTTQFWARVSNNCGSANSRTVTIVVTSACVPPAITLADANPKNVAPGGTVTLTVQATGTGLQFQWYRGTAPDLSNPVAGATTSTATDTPQASTSYFVHVSNACGSKDSASINVTVTTTPACTPPSITGISDDTTVSSNQTATLVVAAAGDPTLHYQWFHGPSGNTSTPVGTDSPTFVTASLFADSEFWVKVSSSCAPPANSRTVKVSVIPAKRRAARH
ncbi:MAG TPA: hypothetical protein VJZ76_05090 [Thermoanaerobaculia bacterium]|nr:hypothetical protein [Thermoanaerobaculia bacterium]